MKAQLFIVDDDANTLASLSRAFRLAGHEATVCDNPIKALEMIKQTPLKAQAAQKRAAMKAPIPDGVTREVRITT